jgi:xylan 1,4-beta-xylosidase
MEAVDGVQHAISVPGQSLGDLPHFWDTFGTGHLGLVLREDRGWGELLKKHLIDGVQNLGLKRVRQHGLFHDDIGIYTEVDGQPVYTWDKSDEIFDFLTENGIAPIIELAPMPSALASDPSYTVFDWNMIVSPPKDYALWQELVFQFVSHSIERYGEEVVNNWYFEVWNEPECCQNKFWGGSLQEYHELYDHSAEGVRRALPTGRVGGPVSSQPVELQDNSMSGKLFLDHVTTDNYVNPGQPGVLGFFTFHTWSFVGGAVDGYFQGIDLLNSYQLNDVQIAVTEFGPTWEFGLFDEPQEMSQGAAFAAQVYADISQRAARNGIRFPIAYSWWVLDDVFEEGLYREDDPFIGCMGLTSREDIHKPAYNTYKFLAQMGHQQLVLDGDPEGHVSGMATADDNAGVQVLIYNGQNPGMGPSDDKYYDVTEEHSVGLTVSGLNPEITYDVTAYRVDETHGNAYATWQTLGRPSMSAMTEADWQSLRDTMDSQPEVLAQAVCGSTFSHQFNLASPGVYFLTFTPSVAP